MANLLAFVGITGVMFGVIALIGAAVEWWERRTR